MCRTRRSGTGEREAGQRVEEFGGGRRRERGRWEGRWRGGGNKLGHRSSPTGDAVAGEHGEPQRERLGPGVQGGMTQLLVAGVEPGAAAVYPTRRRARDALLAVLGCGRVSCFWNAAPGSGPTPPPSSAGAPPYPIPP